MTVATHVWDPDIGPVNVTDFPERDRKRWAKAENTGAWLAYPEDGAAEYHEVFMLELRGKFRFVARGGKQYGPELQSLVAAIYFAYGHGWIDPEVPFERNVRCQVEVRCNTRSLNDRDFDAWQPNRIEAASEIPEVLAVSREVVMA